MGLQLLGVDCMNDKISCCARLKIQGKQSAFILVMTLLIIAISTVLTLMLLEQTMLTIKVSHYFQERMESASQLHKRFTMDGFNRESR